MSTRSLAYVVVPGLMLMLAAIAANVPLANAQSGPAITATPASAPETYVVAGTGFASGVQLRVLEVTCGPLPCGAGGGGAALVTPDASGRFSVTLTLVGAVPTERDFRVIAAIPGERGGLATDPQIHVPLRYAGSSGVVPKAPATGSGAEASEALPFGALFLAGLVLAAGSASIIGLAAVRRR